MKRILALGLTVVVFAAVGATSAPAKTSEQEVATQLASLKRQVKALQKEVRTLRTRVARAEAVGGAGFEFSVCVGAIAADAFRGTWAVIDQMAQATQSRTYFGTQPVVDDAGVCSSNRIQRSQAVPPNMSVFQALYALLR